MRRKSPCWHCGHRSAGCHAQCEDYAGWKAELAHTAELREVATVYTTSAKNVRINWKNMRLCRRRYVK